MVAGRIRTAAQGAARAGTARRALRRARAAGLPEHGEQHGAVPAPATGAGADRAAVARRLRVRRAQRRPRRQGRARPAAAGSPQRPYCTAAGDTAAAGDRAGRVRAAVAAARRQQRAGADGADDRTHAGPGDTGSGAGRVAADRAFDAVAAAGVPDRHRRQLLHLRRDPGNDVHREQCAGRR